MKAPERIYLQIEVEGSDYGYTWCEDMINESDIEYVRKDFYVNAQLEIAELNMRLTAVRNGYDTLLADCEGR